MATSEQLEREAEATRAQIAATLDELRGRMTPGQIVDEFVDYARDSGGAEFFQNFGRQVVGNPLPVTLVGAGLAWLMLAGRRGPSGVDDVAEGMSRTGARRRGASPGAGWTSRFGGVDDIAEGMSKAGDGRPPEAGADSAEAAGLSEHAVRRAHEWARQTRDTAERFNQRVGEAGAGLQDTMRDTVNAAGANVRGAASAAYDTAAATYDAAAERTRQGADAVARGARQMSDSVAASGQGLFKFLQEQPLVLAGLGLAIGSLLGAALPITETENQVMGEASDAAMREAKARAAEQVEKGKAVAAEAWNAAKPELAAQFDHTVDGERAGSADQATLVPSDQDTQPTGEGARREAAQRSE